MAKSRINVLPVYPEFPLTFWSFRKSVEYIGKKATMAPTGLATVLAMLPEDRFELQHIADLNTGPLNDQRINAADMIFTSTMVVQEDSHNEVIDRAHHYGKIVVAGGPFPTSFPERNSKVDHLISGEAEFTLAPFLEDLACGNAKRIYTLEDALRSGRFSPDEIVGGKFPSLARTPLPRWDLVGLKNYATASIQYSRGCPFNCEFCDITKLYGKIPRTKSTEQMIGEFDALLNAGHRGQVFLVDDNFMGKKEDLEKFLPRAIEWQRKHDHPFNFFTQASMNLAWESNKEILRMMVEAGFDQVFLGIESPNEESLKKMKKKQNTVISSLEAVKTIQKAGLEVTGGFIIGSDGDNERIFEDMFSFIQESGIVVPMPGMLTAFKGTDLYKRLELEGRIREESSGNNTHQFRFNFRPKLDEEFLVMGYFNLLENLFDPKNYYARCRTLMSTRGEVKRGRHITLDEISAFGKSMSRQVFAKGGWEYTKYMLETLATRPSRFPEAITHGVKYAHFSQMTHVTADVFNYKEYIEELGAKYKQKIDDYRSALSKKFDTFSEDSRAKVNRTEERARDYATTLLAKAEKKYGRLHKDFKKDAKEALEKLREYIAHETAVFRKKLGLADNQ